MLLRPCQLSINSVDAALMSHQVGCISLRPLFYHLYCCYTRYLVIQFIAYLLPVYHCCRCTDIKGLDDTNLKVCLKAASYKLLYPGASSDSTAEGSAAQAEQLKDMQQAHDLTALHNKHQSRVENMLSRGVVSESSWGFAEQALVAVAVFGMVVFAYSRYQRHRHGHAKHSRSE